MTDNLIGNTLSCYPAAKTFLLDAIHNTTLDRFLREELQGIVDHLETDNSCHLCAVPLSFNGDVVNPTCKSCLPTLGD